jgi:hypothetical protein
MRFVFSAREKIILWIVIADGYDTKLTEVLIPALILSFEKITKNPLYKV